MDVVRVRSEAPPAMAFVALLGAASLGLGGVVALVGRLRPLGGGVWAVLLGAATSATPLAVAGSVLQRTTHHRALGGVTFAVLAFALLLFASGVARRLVTIARSEHAARARVAKIVLVTGAAASVAGAVFALLPALRGSSGALGEWVLDGTTGVGLLGASILLAASERFGRGRVGVILWIVAVGAGGAAAATNGSLRAVLLERAPAAFAAFAVLRG
jgi:hypothetical protein